MKSASCPRHPLALAVALALLASGVHAATITVSDQGDDGNATTCTLRQAIQSALDDGTGGNSSCLAGSGDDVIKFAPALDHADIYLTQGELAITGGNVSIEGSGQTIHGDDISPVLSVKSATFSASKLTLTHEQSSQVSRGMYADHATVTLRDTVISGNSCTLCFGAGIYLHHAASLTLIDSTISGNSSGKSGGGIMVYTGDNLTLVNSTVSGNSASWYGGGIYTGSDATVVNSTVTGNSASRVAGILTSGNTLNLVQSTVTGNSASANAGLSAYYATVLARNSIIAGNPGNGDEIFNYALASTISIGYSVLGAYLATSYAGNGNQFSDEPGLGPLSDNGGPTRTMAVLSGSPALGAGDPALALGPDLTPLNFDQRGPGYPRTLSGLVDIGAFQHQGDRVFADGLEPAP
ncbi:MAG: right-handed parallel beta-helix repeat-containing protein [Rhodanobacteraceae bacterium]